MADDINSIQALLQVAVLEATARLQAATVTAQDAAAASITVEQDRAAAAITCAQIDASWRAGVAQIDANARMSVAATDAGWHQGVANTQAASQEKVASTQLTGTQVTASSSLDAARARATADVQAATIQAGATTTAAGLSSSATEYSADRQLDGVNAKDAADIAMLQQKLAWIDQRWNQVWPSIQGFMAGNHSGGSSARYSDLLSAVGTAPLVLSTLIWTPQQIQQQLNAVYSRSEMKTQTSIRTSEMDLAGRGFASESPIMNAIRMGYGGLGLASATEQATKLRIDSAQSNAEYALKSNATAIELYVKEIEAFSDLEKNAIQLNVGMFSAAASLLAGVV